ncbi:MAG TPA: hypothetical protein VK477_01155, partial [Acidobacteriota bacterium]|nr:hypothetical protein [Acidobacteriota bacterium]
LGKAVAKAKDTTANVAANQAAAMDDVLGGDGAKSTPAPSPGPASPSGSAAKSGAPANTGTTASASTDASGVGTATEPSPTVARPTLPPPPSVAFKAWVQNLRISGVRGGANPRVFIERTAYAPGDLVNPQLGILFETYNAESRMIVFKDKSGAIVERRN